jgi:hypothetical protein
MKLQNRAFIVILGEIERENKKIGNRKYENGRRRCNHEDFENIRSERFKQSYHNYVLIYLVDKRNELYHRHRHRTTV